MPNPVTGEALRDGYWVDIHALTLGLVRPRDNSIWFGPLELIRFGRPTIARSRVEWPIAGGVLARAPGGRLRIEASRGRLVASVLDYQPTLPPLPYAITQLPIHHLWTRLHLLRVRGRQPAPGVPATPTRRLTAAAIDVGLCISLSMAIARRRRVPVLLGIAAGYHVACWSLSGKTLGGAVMKQRVVAFDGSRLSAGQALIRLLALPLAAAWRRNVHDEVSGASVVED